MNGELAQKGLPLDKRVRLLAWNYFFYRRNMEDDDSNQGFVPIHDREHYKASPDDDSSLSSIFNKENEFEIDSLEHALVHHNMTMQ